MPAKSGLSHGFAAFTSILLGSLLSNYLSAHQSLLTDLTVAAGRAAVGLVGLRVGRQVAGLLVIGSALAFCWGIAYHFARH